MRGLVAGRRGPSARTAECGGRAGRAFVVAARWLGCPTAVVRRSRGCAALLLAVALVSFDCGPGGQHSSVPDPCGDDFLGCA